MANDSWSVVFIDGEGHRHLDQRIGKNIVEIRLVDRHVRRAVLASVGSESNTAEPHLGS